MLCRSPLARGPAVRRNFDHRLPGPRLPAAVLPMSAAAEQLELGAADPDRPAHRDLVLGSSPICPVHAQQGNGAFSPC